MKKSVFELVKNIQTKVFDFTLEPLSEVDEEETINLICYCWGNQQLKTWFITKNKKVFLPKGSRLLIEIHGEIVTTKTNVKSTYPQIGDIVGMTNGQNILIKKVFYI